MSKIFEEEVSKICDDVLVAVEKKSNFVLVSCMCSDDVECCAFALICPWVLYRAHEFGMRMCLLSPREFDVQHTFRIDIVW